MDSLLQYMKETRLDNPEISVRDRRLTELDEIVQEVRETEEWETVGMSIYSQGIAQGIKSVVRNMLERGMSDEDICSLTECSEGLVEEVREEIKGGQLAVPKK